MTVMVTAKDVIDRAITLEEGKSIVLPCASYGEMEMLRAQLYKRRKTLMKAHKSIADAIYISREMKAEAGASRYTIFVTKEQHAKGVFITGSNGSIEPFTPPLEEEETERMKGLMRKDGTPEEEIEAFFIKKGEEDFDKAASKLEEEGGK